MTTFKFGINKYKSLYITIENSIELSIKGKEEARAIVDYLVDNLALFLEAREHCATEIYYEGTYDGATLEFNISTITKDGEVMTGEKFINELGWIGLSAT